eukprot:4760027-Pyramimonas_sp.AAC.1
MSLSATRPGQKRAAEVMSRTRCAAGSASTAAMRGRINHYTIRGAQGGKGGGTFLQSDMQAATVPGR